MAKFLATLATCSEIFADASGEMPVWLPALPADGGIIEGRDGRKYRLDDVRAVMRRTSERGTDTPIDVEHDVVDDGRYDLDGAIGWIKPDAWHVRGDNTLWAFAPNAFEPHGREIVLKRSHKYISPAFYVEEDPTGKTDGIILEIAALSLVKVPNLDIPAINSITTAEPSAHRQNKDHIMDPKELRIALGLAEDASEDEVQAKIKILSEATKAPTEDPVSTAINNLRGEVKSLIANAVKPFQSVVANSHEKLVTNAIDGYVKAGKIQPNETSKKFWADKCKTAEDLKATCEYLDQLPALVSTQSRKLDLGTKDGELTEQQLEVCNKIGVKPDAYKKTQPTWIRK